MQKQSLEGRDHCGLEPSEKPSCNRWNVDRHWRRGGLCPDEEEEGDYFGKCQGLTRLVVESVPRKECF